MLSRLTRWLALFRTAALRDSEKERKLATDPLRESEARFRTLADLSSDWYWLQDENFRFTHISDEAAQKIGYPASASLGCAHWELPITPVSCTWEEHRAVLAAHQTFRDFEYWRLDRAGRRVYVSVSGAPMFNDAGRFLGYQGVARNINGRKAIEDALRESEGRFRALTDLSSDWYWLQDENFRFTHFSDGAAKVYAASASLGRTRWELPFTPVSCTWEEHRAVLAAHQTFRDFEYWRLDDAGRRLYVSVSGAPMFNDAGRFLGYQGVARNISGRKAIEDALRASEERYALAMKASQAGYWDWDLVTGEYHISNRLLKGSRLPAGTILKTRADSLARMPFHPDDRRKWDEAVKALFAGKDERLQMDVRSVILGELRWYHLHGLCTRDASGKAVRWTGSSTDITDRKRAEEALRESQERSALAMEAAEAGHSDWNLETGEFYISPRLLEICGYPPGTQFADRADWVRRFPFHPEDRPKWEAVNPPSSPGETVLSSSAAVRRGAAAALLTSALDGSLPPEAMELPPPPGDTLVRTGVCAVRIDRERREVHTADGEVVPYGRLVLATGATPLIPALPGLRTGDGAPAPGVAVLRTLADCARLIDPAAVAAKAPVTILGAGSLGVEAAFALAHMGRPVTLVHPGPWPIDHLLDQAAGALVTARLADAGVTLVTGRGAASYADGTLTLDDGDTAPAPTLLLCTGVLPEAGLARAAGLSVRTGIVVDDTLRTDDPLIHALGDCAEHRGNRGGSLASGWAQAEALARFLATGARGVAAARRVLRPRIAGPGLVVLGMPGAAPAEEVVTLNDPANARYARLELTGERITAGVLLGFDRAIATTTELYVHDLPVPRDRLSLFLGRAPRLAGSGPTEMCPDTVVCLCNNVTHQVLTDAWHAGARQVPDLADATRATTGCGGCARQVEAICSALASASDRAAATGS